MADTITPRQAKRAARAAWRLVQLAKDAGSDRAEIDRLTAVARNASDRYWQAIGYPNPMSYTQMSDQTWNGR